MRGKWEQTSESIAAVAGVDDSVQMKMLKRLTVHWAPKR
jgi:hypothetical protein